MKFKKDSESRDVNPIRLLAGGFLIFLAWRLFSGYREGSASEPVLSIIFSIVFFLIGILLLALELKAYLEFTGKLKKHGKSRQETESNAHPEDME